jgi:hypothetical protein
MFIDVTYVPLKQSFATVIFYLPFSSCFYLSACVSFLVRLSLSLRQPDKTSHITHKTTEAPACTLRQLLVIHISPIVLNQPAINSRCLRPTRFTSRDRLPHPPPRCPRSLSQQPDLRYQPPSWRLGHLKICRILIQ